MPILNELLDTICKPIWDQAILQYPEILEDCSYEEFKFEIKTAMHEQNNPE